MADFLPSLGSLLSQSADGSLEVRRASGDVLLSAAEVASIQALPPFLGFPSKTVCAVSLRLPLSTCGSDTHA